MLQRRVTPNADDPANPVVRYVSPRLEALGVRHGFSTRLGGVSTGPFASMNLGNPSGCEARDTAEHLDENHRRLFAAAGLEASARHARVHQVHGASVARVRAGVAHDHHAFADAIIGDDPDSIVSVRVADCVPVLLATPDGSAVAAVHAGWRGVVAGVLTAAINELLGLGRERAGAGGMGLALVEPDAPDSLLAAIGPGIGAESFEVGPEVAAEFARVFSPELAAEFVVPRRRGDGPPDKWLVDLRAALEFQSLAAGIPRSNIDRCDRCTFRDADEFFSHRREHGVTGRMAAFIAPAPTPPPSPASRP